MRDDGRDVVYAFVGCDDLLAHPTSLTQFSFSRENSHEMSAHGELSYKVHNHLAVCPEAEASFRPTGRTSTKAIWRSSGKCPFGVWRTRQASGRARPLYTTWIISAVHPRPTPLPSMTSS